MPLIEDGAHAVQSESIAVVVKPDARLTDLEATGTDGDRIELVFATEAERDHFYTRLVAAMNAPHGPV